MTRTLIALVTSIAAATTAVSAEIRVVLPPESTTVDFSLKATMHTVHGTAVLERGAFAFDTDTGEASGEGAGATTRAPSL